MQHSTFLMCLVALATASLAAGQPATEPAQQLDPLVVTGTRTAQRLSEVPIRTELVTRADLAPAQPRTLADAVEFIPGIRVENDCQNCNFSQIRLLGLEGAYSQILIDGQPLVSSLAAVYAVEQMPASLIERIEVVKGGGSALYGPGSIGGVVNLIPHTPQVTGLTLRLTTESMSGDRLGDKQPGVNFSTGLQADLVWSDARSVLTLFGQGDRELAVDLSGDGYSEVGLKELASGGLRFTREFAAVNGRLTLEASRTFENRRGGNNLDAIEHEADIAESIQTLRQVVAASWSQEIAPAHDFRLAASFVRTVRDSYYGAGRDPDAYGRTRNPLLVLDSQFNHRLGHHLVSWGAQHTVENLNDIQPAYSRQTDASYRNTGVFAQDEWAFTDDWELLAGARFDDNNQIADGIVSPRLALMWTPTAGTIWRAGIASGFRAPQVFDEDLHITQVAGGGQIIKNDPALAEESARTLTLGAERQFRIGRALWLLEANLFHTRIADSFILEEDPAQSTTNESVLVRRNGHGARIHGGELNLGFSLGRNLRLQCGLVEQRSLYDNPIAPLDGTSTRRLQRTPDRYGTATLDAKLPAGLSLFVGAKFTGPMQIPHVAPGPADIPADSPYVYIAANRLERSPSFVTWDASLTREFERGERGGRHRDITLRIGVKNLTDERQRDFDQGELRDSGYVYGPRFPRSFYISTEWRL